MTINKINVSLFDITAIFCFWFITAVVTIDFITLFICYLYKNLLLHQWFTERIMKQLRAPIKYAHSVTDISSSMTEVSII